MNWELFTTTGSGFSYDGIRLFKNYITVTSSVKKRIVGIERVFIKFDKENKAIMLCPTNNQTGYLIANKQNNSYAITCPLYRVMPIGRYYFKEKTDEGYIFINK